MKRFTCFLFSIILVSSANLFAQGNRAKTNISGKTTPSAKATVQTKPIKIEPVDMGLSVKWANAAIGATTTRKSGKYNTINEAKKLCENLGEGWRLPSQNELDDLLYGCFQEIIVANGKPTGIRFWSKKNHASITFNLGECGLYINGKKEQANPSDNKGTPMYTYIIPSTTGFICLITLKIDESTHKEIKNRVGNVLQQLGPDFGEWPDEAKRDLEKGMSKIINGFAGTSVDFKYMAAGYLDEKEFDDRVKLLFTPVFDANDDE